MPSNVIQKLNWDTTLEKVSDVGHFKMIVTRIWIVCIASELITSRK